MKRPLLKKILKVNYAHRLDQSGRAWDIFLSSRRSFEIAKQLLLTPTDIFVIIALPGLDNILWKYHQDLDLWLNLQSVDFYINTISIYRQENTFFLYCDKPIYLFYISLFSIKDRIFSMPNLLNPWVKDKKEKESINQNRLKALINVNKEALPFWLAQISVLHG